MLMVIAKNGPNPEKVRKELEEKGVSKNYMGIQFAGQTDMTEVTIEEEVRRGVFKGKAELDGDQYPIQFEL